MPKVMILDHVLSDVFELEKIFKARNYTVSLLTGAYGILAKLDYEKPHFLLFNPDMPNTDSDLLLKTISSAPSLQRMVIILICEGEAEAVEEYCLIHGLHGFYIKGQGFEELPAYLEQLYQEHKSLVSSKPSSQLGKSQR